MTTSVRPASGAGKLLRAALYLGLPAAAVATAYLATRTTQAAPVQAHDHTATVGGDTARSVMLSPTDAHRIGVTYAVVSAGAGAREIRTVGQITFDESRVKLVSSRVDGWVERLYVDFTGQQVAAGTQLLVLYSPMVLSTEEELLLAKRLQADVAGAGEDTRAHAATLVSSARERLARWDVPPTDIAAVESAGHARRSFALRSPVGGFVIEKNVLQGQRVMAGDPLFKIADLSRVWLEGDVYEQDIPLVRIGQGAVAELQAIPGATYGGRVVYIDPTVNPETRTMRIRVELPNENHRLKPGMFATLRLTVPANQQTLTVPRAAVLSTGERHIVFVKRVDGMLEPREVQVGVASTDRIEILAGLARGETVVASATFLVDAESHLGSALGGMGDMPGMDIAAPKKKPE